MEKSKEHKHKVAYTVLIVVILLLLSRGEQGRYAISGDKNGVCVLDTKTSKLWIRGTTTIYYLGTNENPKVEVTTGVKVEAVPQKQSELKTIKTFEEIE